MAFKAKPFAYIEKLLKQNILNVMPVGGGSINQVYCLQTDSIKYLIKINDREIFPGMFNAEAKGLETIKKTRTISVPEVVLQDDFENESFLILEWIDNKRPTAKGSASLGEQLARMHQHTANQFGVVTDNYMGSLTQSNRSHQSWSEFFVEERLKPMVQIARHNKWISSSYVDKFDRLYERLPGLFEEEKPSLIHGDLWSGNFMCDGNSRPVLIDPAVYFGHRAIDLAMTTLFGGFDKSFYEAYRYHFPLPNNYLEQWDVSNLYPLLIHLNLFGSSYLHDIAVILKKFTA